MMTQTTKNTNLREINVHTEWKGAMQTEQQIRDFAFTIDEPTKLGGQNQAPTPLEYVLGSFNGCILVVIQLVAKEIEFAFSDIEIDSKGIVDRRGLFGEPDVPLYYTKVENNIKFITDESQDRIEQLKEIVKGRCPLFNLIKDAGVEIELNWRAVSENNL